MKRFLLYPLILLNALVLLGQLWPSGAPPFAYNVTVLFLIASLLYFTVELVSMRKNNKPE
ncbi:MAG: hypothetical protein U0X58_00850 [Flavobacteriaceae bacterium]|nr:hypothetical protein [Bacteroidota bacterium]